MKNNFSYTNLLLLFLLGTLSSCEKWLDIVPQTQIESDKAFESEAGFQDALTGVYLKISEQSLYGREMTFGMLDGLAGQFQIFGLENEYYPIVNYQYNEDDFISKNDALFSGGYNAIANLNNLIANLDRKGASMFSGVNYQIIRGETHALRAMLHFDLLRLYSPSLASANREDRVLPYVTTLGTQPNPRLNTKSFLNQVLADLQIAAEALATSDPIIPAHAANATTYLRDRGFKMNYYAVKALQARVNLYAQKEEDALDAAQEVIDSDVFPWTPVSEITQSSIGSRNRIFTQELMFSLTISNLSTYVNPYFESTFEQGTASLLARSAASYATLFGTNSDYRYAYSTETTIDGLRRYSIKLYHPSGISGGFNGRLPMLRLSEMYYIAAECLKTTSPAQAIAYLNEVRKRRNIGDLQNNLDDATIQEEIELEYRREFIGEGQLFYYYKRMDKAQLPDGNVLMTDSQYVLPLPDREISFGF